MFELQYRRPMAHRPLATLSTTALPGKYTRTISLTEVSRRSSTSRLMEGTDVHLEYRRKECSTCTTKPDEDLLSLL